MAEVPVDRPVWYRPGGMLSDPLCKPDYKMTFSRQHARALRKRLHAEDLRPGTGSYGPVPFRLTSVYQRTLELKDPSLCPVLFTGGNRQILQLDPDILVSLLVA